MAISEELRQDLYRAMWQAYDELIDLVTADAFQALLDDLYTLPPDKRPVFVREVLLDADSLAERGITLPKDVYIQRSTFGDRRPTLFCVKKYLPPELRKFWQNVNLTFDNPYDDAEIPKGAAAWRAPLPVDVQYGLMTGAIPRDLLE